MATGDRVRFITRAGANGTPGTDLGNVMDSVWDMEIIKQDVDNNTIYVQKFGHLALV